VQSLPWSIGSKIFIFVPVYPTSFFTSLSSAYHNLSPDSLYILEDTMPGTVTASDAEARIYFLCLMSPNQSMTDAQATQIATLTSRSVSNVR
jgi:hypothetical protein